MTDLTGKTAIVLGASAEGGTGWAIAECFAARGAKVVAAARSFGPLQKLAAKIGGMAVACDAGDEAQIRHLRDVTLETYGRIDIAVNSAATPTLSAIADATPAILQRGIQVNYFGMVYFVRDMAAVIQTPGSIVLISSMSATHPIKPHFAYACGKAAMECLVKYAAAEYGPRGIRVNAIRVGTVMSEMAAAHYNSPGVSERFAHEIPLGRLGQPEEIADAVLWLAGSPYITGSTLDISGGNQINRFPFLEELPGQGGSYEGAGALYDRQKAGGA